MNNPYEAIILLNNIMICSVTFRIKIYRKIPKILIATWEIIKVEDGSPVAVLLTVVDTVQWGLRSKPRKCLPPWLPGR
jgi:hypothetical protein